MKKFAILSALLFLIFFSCEKKTDYMVPDCIMNMVPKDSTNFCHSGASVDMYLFQGKPVYVFDLSPCLMDATAEVYNDKCEVIGYLGGIAGNNIVNDVLFSRNAKFIKNIWKN